MQYFLACYQGTIDSTHPLIIEHAQFNLCQPATEGYNFTKYTVVLSRGIVPFFDQCERCEPVLSKGSSLVIGPFSLQFGRLEITRTASSYFGGVYLFGEIVTSPDVLTLSELSEWYDKIIQLSLQYQKDRLKLLEQEWELEETYKRALAQLTE